MLLSEMFIFLVFMRLQSKTRIQTKKCFNERGAVGILPNPAVGNIKNGNRQPGKWRGRRLRINFYDARLSEDGKTMLVKEKGVNYQIDSVNNPKNIARLMRDILDMDRLAEEHCYMIAMNSACRITGIFPVSRGTVNTSVVSARELYMRALLIGAAMVVLVHNHPSGRAYATESDMETTKKLKEAGKLIGIPLVDHIIVGGGGYFSFMENGMLQDCNGDGA